jgi:hypothetical protein
MGTIVKTGSHREIPKKKAEIARRPTLNCRSGAYSGFDLSARIYEYPWFNLDFEKLNSHPITECGDSRVF